MQTRPLNEEEFEALTKDLNDVLIKHNAELGVKSTIELTKRIEDTKPNGEEIKNSETETPKAD